MTSNERHEVTLELIDRHFSGCIGREQERDLRTHLPGCGACRDYYKRSLIVSRLDPKAPNALTRLAAGLGFQAQRGARWPWLAGFSLAMAATAILLVAIPRADEHEMPYGARGGTTSSDPARLLVYRLRSDGPPEIVDDTPIRTNDELAFAYQNRAGYSRLAIFGVDDQQRVYWYHPAWTKPTERPVTIAISRGSGVHELSEGIVHPLASGRLRLFGVFSHAALSVDDIERAVAQAGPHATQLPIAGPAWVAVETLQVQP